jgi:hypothetical protein
MSPEDGDDAEGVVIDWTLRRSIVFRRETENGADWINPPSTTQNECGLIAVGWVIEDATRSKFGPSMLLQGADILQLGGRGMTSTNLTDVIEKVLWPRLEHQGKRVVVFELYSTTTPGRGASRRTRTVECTLVRALRSPACRSPVEAIGYGIVCANMKHWWAFRLSGAQVEALW